MFQGILRTPWHCSVWMIGLLLPQLYWFRIMFNGALKVIQEENNSKDVDTSNSAPIITTNLETCGNLYGREKDE